MNVHKLIGLLFIVFSLYNGYAQKEEAWSLEDFQKIKDTIIYQTKIGDILNGIVDKKLTIEIEEIDHLIKIGEKLNSNKGIGTAYRVKGSLHKRKLEYLVAIKNFEKAIVYFKKAKNENNIARTYNDMFVVEYIKGNLDKGVSYLLESKKYFEQLNDSLNLAFLHNNLGAVYWTLKDYTSAEAAFSQSLKLQEHSETFRIKGTIMNNLANIYIRQKQYSKAKQIIEKAILFNKKNKKRESLALSYSTLAVIYMEKEEYRKARMYNDSTLYLLSDVKNDITYIKAQQRLGNIELQLGNYALADQLLTKSREAFHKMDSKKNLLENYKLSSKLDSARGNLMGALTWQKEWKKISDIRMNEMSAKKMENAEMHYQAELAQLLKISEQEKLERKSKAELFRYKAVSIVIAGVLLISLIILVFIVKARRERKKLIAELHESNQVKNKLFSIISHDLKNEVSGLDNTLKLLKDNSISKIEFEEIVPLLANRTNQTSIMLNNLLNWSKSQMKALNVKPVSFDMTELITHKFEFFKVKAEEKNIQLINKLDSTKIYADKDMVAIVAQNLIANAIKFCNPGDSIALVSKEREDSYEICFEDTGVGIAASNLNKLFAEDTFTTFGTQNESGTGLGLRICKELIELNKGEIKVESELGKGSTFYVLLPKAA